VAASRAVAQFPVLDNISHSDRLTATVSVFVTHAFLNVQTLPNFSHCTQRG